MLNILILVYNYDSSVESEMDAPGVKNNTNEKAVVESSIDG